MMKQAIRVGGAALGGALIGGTLDLADGKFNGPGAGQSTEISSTNYAQQHGGSTISDSNAHLVLEHPYAFGGLLTFAVGAAASWLGRTQSLNVSGANPTPSQVDGTQVADATAEAGATTQKVTDKTLLSQLKGDIEALLIDMFSLRFNMLPMLRIAINKFNQDNNDDVLKANSASALTKLQENTGTTVQSFAKNIVETLSYQEIVTMLFIIRQKPTISWYDQEGFQTFTFTENTQNINKLLQRLKTADEAAFNSALLPKSPPIDHIPQAAKADFVDLLQKALGNNNAEVVRFITPVLGQRFIKSLPDLLYTDIPDNYFSALVDQLNKDQAIRLLEKIKKERPRQQRHYTQDPIYSIADIDALLEKMRSQSSRTGERTL